MVIADDVGFNYTNSNSDEAKISSTEATTITISPTLSGEESSEVTISSVIVTSGSATLSQYPGSNSSEYITSNSGSKIVFASGIYSGTTIQIFVSLTYNNQTYGETIYFTVE